MTSMSNLYYKEEEKGKVIKSSKIHYHWGFSVNEVNHTIEFLDSRLSTKKQIVINGKVLYRSEGIEFITKTFDLADHTFVLIPYGNRYELRVDGNPFKHLIMIESNKRSYHSSKYIQNYQTDNDENLVHPQRTQSNLEVKRLFSFNIKPKNTNKGGLEVCFSTNNYSNGNSNSNSKENIVDNKEKEINLFDLNLDFTHSQPSYHPYSSNNFNYNIRDINQYSNNTINRSSQMLYQFGNNSNANDLYKINSIYQKQPVIDYFD